MKSQPECSPSPWGKHQGKGCWPHQLSVQAFQNEHPESLSNGSDPLPHCVTALVSPSVLEKKLLSKKNLAWLRQLHQYSLLIKIRPESDSWFFLNKLNKM